MPRERFLFEPAGGRPGYLRRAKPSGDGRCRSNYRQALERLAAEARTTELTSSDKPSRPTGQKPIRRQVGLPEMSGDDAEALVTVYPDRRRRNRQLEHSQSDQFPAATDIVIRTGRNTLSLPRQPSPKESGVTSNSPGRRICYSVRKN